LHFFKIEEKRKKEVKKRREDCVTQRELENSIIEEQKRRLTRRFDYGSEDSKGTNPISEYKLSSKLEIEKAEICVHVVVDDIDSEVDDVLDEVEVEYGIENEHNIANGNDTSWILKYLENLSLRQNTEFPILEQNLLPLPPEPQKKEIYKNHDLNNISKFKISALPVEPLPPPDNNGQ